MILESYCGAKYRKNRLCSLSGLAILSFLPVNFGFIRNKKMEDFQISAPDFVSATVREKINPWRILDDYHDFRIEPEQLGDNEIENTLRLVEKYGICHLRLHGLSPDASTLRAYFESFGQVMDEQNLFQGDIKDIKPQPDVAPVTGDSTGDLGFHVDGTQTPDQPALLAFQYVVPASLGGNSRFVDLAGLLFSFSDEIRLRLFDKLSHRDTAVFTKSGMELVSPIFHLPDNDSLAARIRIDNIICLKDECKEEFGLLREALLSDDFGIKLKPRAGDIIVFDNWRILHARDTVLGNNQRHHRRVWMEALLRKYQARFKLGIRPVSARFKAMIQENNSRPSEVTA
jgi:hypothetical protein